MQQGAQAEQSLTALLLTDPSLPLSEQELLDGWIALFDGQTLCGWKPQSATAWHATEGELVCAGTGRPGLLLSSTRFRNYEFRGEVWLASGGNSGIFLRTVAHPQSPTAGCLEWNFCDTHATYPTGSLVGRRRADKRTKVEDGWHRFRVTLDGTRFVGQIDDATVLTFDDPEVAATGGGFIGLQSNGGEVRFRKLILKPLSLNNSFDRHDENWHVVDGSQATFDWNKSELTLKGQGYLASNAEFQDFIVQGNVRLNARDVNSGLFFRAMPPTSANPANGYEMQLQSTVANNDRTRPADYGSGFGAGAIFRRQPARYVNCSDEKWFAMTLIADGNHFTSWINGLQVTDFVDERPVKENSREGRRDQAGFLLLQGHDPKTDVSFKNVRVSPLELPALSPGT